jgi:hypothetical protein
LPKSDKLLLLQLFWTPRARLAVRRTALPPPTIIPMSNRSVLGLRCFVAAASLAVLSGCASFTHIANYPTPNQPTTVAIGAKPMSKMSELPIGAFYDPSRQIIISGHQKGLGVGMMFGLIGVMVADQTNKSGAEARFGAAAHGSTTDLGSIAQTALADELARSDAPHWRQATGPAALVLSPYAVFTVLPSGKARLYAMLRAEIPVAGADPSWSVRYFVRAPGEYTIEGDDGWMTHDRFADGMRQALRRAIRVCAKDTAGQLTGTRKVKAVGVFPYLNTDKISLPFIVVSEEPDALVARLAAGDAMVLSGTHVLNRADYVIADGDFKDPRQ